MQAAPGPAEDEERPWGRILPPRGAGGAAIQVGEAAGEQQHQEGPRPCVCPHGAAGSGEPSVAPGLRLASGSCPHAVRLPSLPTRRDLCPGVVVAKVAGGCCPGTRTSSPLGWLCSSHGQAPAVPTSPPWVRISPVQRPQTCPNWGQPGDAAVGPAVPRSGYVRIRRSGGKRGESTPGCPPLPLPSRCGKPPQGSAAAGWRRLLSFREPPPGFDVLSLHGTGELPLPG